VKELLKYVYTYESCSKNKSVTFLFLYHCVYLHLYVMVTVRFPSDATAAAGQRKPFDSVQMTASSKFFCVKVYTGTGYLIKSSPFVIECFYTVHYFISLIN